MIDITIREAKPEDAEKIIEYIKKIGAETNNLSYGAEGSGMTVEQEQSFLRTMQDDKQSIFLCAWKDTELVGTANLHALPRRMSHRANLGITVRKSEWNNKIGSKLLQKIIMHAKNNGLEFINLEVRSDNMAAIHLYTKFGFKKTGVIPAFFKIGFDYINFDVMSLDLRY
ncbi:GNAT family N-acetyltransferase [Atopobium fossor]|uniref:GNAT family N-acetyltransferase n=1 Tax=Atopobium fossor TaxID=39487 RepID=UPI00040E65EB|nr:GNAT family N-acetyltransferase [Atopobium fossor]